MSGIFRDGVQKFLCCKEKITMFDKTRLKAALVKYKERFVQKQWPDENFKWEAVKCFQDNWDVNADDFSGMLKKSLSKTDALLASPNNFPAQMIIKFAEIVPEEVRSMFLVLFDESRDVYERIDTFKQKSYGLLERYGSGAKHHYQKENPICTYLWLRYPDKYYVYKFREVKAVSDELQSDYIFKTGDYTNNIRNFLAFYNEICAELQQDEELKNMLVSQITETHYPDTELRTLTMDVGFFIRTYLKKDVDAPSTDEWWPIHYSPELTVEDWESLLYDNEVFTDSSLEIMKRMLDCGGKATCEELVMKYGESEDFYSSTSTDLSKRIVQKTGCPVMSVEDERNKWWPVLYIGKAIKKDEKGSIVWKLRTELSEALGRVDLSKVNLYQNSLLSVNGNGRYKKDDFLKEVYMTEAKYDRLAAVLKKKKNIILQGAPGVGKTFAAKRLAYSMMGEVDDSRIEYIQFHQNYSYEDFMMGYKPVDDGFELKYGIFYRFCQKAENHLDKDYFFIIDEINRGNMSKIFGELLMLIEPDYRGNKITLAYNGLSFSVPKNLHIIGMMNTADRSLAMIDYALRRRFSFFDMEPGFDSEGFIHYQNGFSNDTFNSLVERMKELNREIMNDKSLGKGFCIGHSYFCNMDVCSEESLKDVVEFDILPMLSEYWFDDSTKLQHWENRLRGVFQ